MRQTINVQVAHAVNATLEFWPAAVVPVSRTLLLYAHGMQDQAFYEPPGIATRNYAFTIPFNRALYNPTFTQDIDNFEIYVDAFVRYPGQFNSRTPLLYIYPYLFPQHPPIDGALDALDGRNVCDLMYLTDLPIGTDYIRLQQLVAAAHPRGGTFHTTYDSFFLAACRTMPTVHHPIGFGGGVAAPPDGLYRGDDSYIVRWD